MAKTTKYHVNKNTGRAGICRATMKGCPLGADTPHFNTKEEAKAHIEKTEANNNSQFSTMKKKSNNKQNNTAVFISTSLKKFDLTSEIVNNKVGSILSGYDSNNRCNYRTYFDFDYTHIPEEECGTYNGYYELNGVFSVNTDKIRDNIVESLTHDEDANISKEELDDLRNKLTPIIDNLIIDHDLDKANNYYAEGSHDYYQDTVSYVYFKDTLSQEMFVKDIMNLAEGTYQINN